MKIHYFLISILILAFFLSCGDKQEEPQEQKGGRVNEREMQNQGTNDSRVNDNEFIAKDGGFAIAFPWEPERMTQNVPFDMGDIEMIIYQATDSPESYVYMISYNDYPTDLVKSGDKEKMLDEAMNGFIGNLYINLDSSKKIKYENHPGVEFTASGEAKGSPINLKAKMFLVDNRLYQLVVLDLSSSIKEDEMDKFLTSFRLL